MVNEGSSARGINRQQRVHGDEVGEEGAVERGESGMWRTVSLQEAYGFDRGIPPDFHSVLDEVRGRGSLSNGRPIWKR